jgi:predicted ATP-grasp superfamily ATP-dependent carboligase
MGVGAFDIAEHAPELYEPHVLAVIPSWMDAGQAASLTISRFEQHFHAEELGSLARPGEFFDYTRYRPTLSRKDGVAALGVSNIVMTFARQQAGNDLIFLSLPEPHARAEAYIEAILEFFTHFNVKRYTLLGSVYDMAPFTRPLLVTGTASNPELRDKLNALKVVESYYEGPTSVLYRLGEEAQKAGIEAMSLVVHLPGYMMIEEDHRGLKKLMEVIGSLYDLPVATEDSRLAETESEQFKLAAEQFLEQNPQLRSILKQLEDNYDARVNRDKEEVRLSPEVEKFLQELSKRFDQD